MTEERKRLLLIGKANSTRAQLEIETACALAEVDRVHQSRNQMILEAFLLGMALGAVLTILVRP